MTSTYEAMGRLNKLTCARRYCGKTDVGGRIFTNPNIQYIGSDTRSISEHWAIRSGYPVNHDADQRYVVSSTFNGLYRKDPPPPANYIVTRSQPTIRWRSQPTIPFEDPSQLYREDPSQLYRVRSHAARPYREDPSQLSYAFPANYTVKIPANYTVKIPANYTVKIPCSQLYREDPSQLSWRSQPTIPWRSQPTIPWRSQPTIPWRSHATSYTVKIPANYHEDPSQLYTMKIPANYTVKTPVFQHDIYIQIHIYSFLKTIQMFGKVLGLCPHTLVVCSNVASLSIAGRDVVLSEHLIPSPVGSGNAFIRVTSNSESHTDRNSRFGTVGGNLFVGDDGFARFHS